VAHASIPIRQDSIDENKHDTRPLQTPANNDLAIAINTANLKNILRDVQSNYPELLHGSPPSQTVAT
jgi:hypothetical protein